MISQKFVIIILIFLSALSILIYVSIHGGQRNGSGLTSPASNALDIKITSTPVPTIWLTPEDFSSDFETLKASF